MRALIIQGGWEGHEPTAVANYFAGRLRTEGFDVTISDTLEVLNDGEAVASYDLISPTWTMGHLSAQQSANLSRAVQGGTGLGGFHGGMGDAFRGDLDYEWMVGGHFVGHPHVGEYVVQVVDRAHPITEGLPESFNYLSEQYYLLVDPGIAILATTAYRHQGQEVTMPVIWTKQWGAGRVFYSALGHRLQEFIDHPCVANMTVAGMKWAARR